MSTIKSSAENLTLNADGSGNDVLIQSNGSTKTIVTAEGNVGIGTTSINLPSGSGLEVYDGSIPRIKLANSTTGNASGDGFDIHIDGSSKDVKLFQREAANMILATSGSERMRIAADGNVGIGTTPESGQGSNSQGLYVGTHASLISSGAYESVNLSENAYLATAASDAWKYRDTSHAARHEMKAGVHTLKVAASGSADAAITWNTGFEVLNDGKARAKNGLLFGTDTAAANALDDYEEGSWTIVLTGSSSGSGNVGTGYYTKIGRMVYCTYTISNTTFPTFAGNMNLSLPFTGASGMDNRQENSGDIYFYPLAKWTSGTSFTGLSFHINGSSPTVGFFQIKRIASDRQAQLGSSQGSNSGAGGMYARFSVTYTAA